MSELPMLRLVLHEDPLSLQLLRQALENYHHQCRALSIDCATRARLQVKSAPANATLALERRAGVYCRRTAVLAQLIAQLPDVSGPPAPIGFPEDT